MEGERREFAAGRGEEERLTKKNFDLEKLHIPKEKNRSEQTEIPTMAMENQTLLGGISSTEDGFITEIFSQNSPFNSENLNLENTVINKPGEEGFHSSQDSHLCAMAVGETLLDQFKYPLTIESQNTILKVKIQPLVEDNHGNEILGKCQKLQDLNPSEEAKHTYPPYPLSHSYNVHFLSSLMMQQRNSNVLSLSTCPPEGTINQNVRMIPVIGELNGKNIEDVIAQGNGKLASMPVGGAVAVSAGPGSAAPAAAPAAAEEKKEEKKEESEESDDMGFGLFD